MSSVVMAVNLKIAYADSYDMQRLENSKSKPATVVFVCGGNTGRSVMAEWYTRHKYSNYNGVIIDVLSRGSGIDPLDDVYTESFARGLIIQGKDATPAQIDLHRATPVSLIDILNSDIVLTMGEKYNNRLFNQIDRECSNFNLDYLNRSFNKEQWSYVCKHKDKLLKAKIHTLIGCATGFDREIPDAYGKDEKFYINVRNEIMKYTDIVMNNANLKYKSGSWCVPSLSRAEELK